MRHEKTVSVSKIKPLWEPWEEDETPRKYFTYIQGLIVELEQLQTSLSLFTYVLTYL